MSDNSLPDTGPIDWVLSTTRSVRKRLDFDRPVEKEILLTALELAIQAPTGSNAQGWQWLIVEDRAKKEAIAELYRRSWAKYTGARRLEPAPDDPQRRRVYESAQYFTDNLHRAPYFVIPAITLEAPWGKLPQAGVSALYGSILPAAWSFLLALRSRGLGSVWTTLHLFYEQETREILGVPENVAQVALFPVAYTIGTDFKPAKRTVALESITHWDSWGGASSSQEIPRA